MRKILIEDENLWKMILIFLKEKNLEDNFDEEDFEIIDEEEEEDEVSGDEEDSIEEDSIEDEEDRRGFYRG